jgi:hypothetical protein
LSSGSSNFLDEVLPTPILYDPLINLKFLNINMGFSIMLLGNIVGSKVLGLLYDFMTSSNRFLVIKWYFE